VQAVETGATFELPDMLDPTKAQTLLAAFKERRGKSIEVDAQAVALASTVCMQVLLSAAASWARDGKRFMISNPSAPFRDAVAILGIDPVQLPMASDSA
jgi:chemotaxis protein CheX